MSFIHCAVCVNEVMINVQQKKRNATIGHMLTERKRKQRHLHSRQKLTSSPCTFNTYVKKGWIYKCKHARKVNFIPINHNKAGYL